MHNENNNIVGGLFGFAGGIYKYHSLTGNILIRFSNVDFAYIHDLLRSSLTALICGAAGVMGKVILTTVWNYIRHKFFKKKT